MELSYAALPELPDGRSRVADGRSRVVAGSKRGREV